MANVVRSLAHESLAPLQSHTSSGKRFLRVRRDRSCYRDQGAITESVPKSATPMALCVRRLYTSVIAQRSELWVRRSGLRQRACVRYPIRRKQDCTEVLCTRHAYYCKPTDCVAADVGNTASRMLNNTGIQARQRELARDKVLRSHQEDEIANRSPDGSRYHTSSTDYLVLCHTLMFGLSPPAPAEPRAPIRALRTSGGTGPRAGAHGA